MYTIIRQARGVAGIPQPTMATSYLELLMVKLDDVLLITMAIPFMQY